jgi:hypothetical protein
MRQAGFLLIVGMLLLSWLNAASVNFAQEASPPPASQGAGSSGAQSERAISVPGFRVEPGGSLSWSDKLRLGHGGGEGNGLPPANGLIRAQPGGNLVLQPNGDYMRCALDLLPTRGKQPDMDALDELTLHRVAPTQRTQEMLSLSALARSQGVFGMIVEAHGDGVLRPLVFMVVRGGINPGEPSYYAEAMRMTEQGTIALGLARQGIPRPVDSLTIDQPPPQSPGSYDSDRIQWIGKSRDASSIHTANWRAGVRVADPQASSTFALSSSIDGRPDESRLEVSDRGNLELPSAGSGVILRSPNGKRWQLTVDDSGQLSTRPAQ